MLLWCKVHTIGFTMKLIASDKSVIYILIYYIIVPLWLDNTLCVIGVILHNKHRNIWVRACMSVCVYACIYLFFWLSILIVLTEWVWVKLLVFTKNLVFHLGFGEQEWDITELASRELKEVMSKPSHWMWFSLVHSASIYQALIPVVAGARLF